MDSTTDSFENFDMAKMADDMAMPNEAARIPAMGSQGQENISGFILMRYTLDAMIPESVPMAMEAVRT